MQTGLKKIDKYGAQRTLEVVGGSFSHRTRLAATPA
jgi:hypothetical protein